MAEPLGRDREVADEVVDRFFFSTFCANRDKTREVLTGIIAAARAEERETAKELARALSRLCETTESLIRESTDPGTEALAAIYCARDALAKTEDWK